MHAILISDDNMDKIKQYVPEGDDLKTVEFCLKRKSDWYVIRDYVTHDGIFHHNVVMPGFVIEVSFIVDLDIVKDEWDVIFRLA